MSTQPKKTRRRTDVNFETYLYKILKQVHPTIGISSSTLKSMNSLIFGLAKQISLRGLDFALLDGRRTITSREIQSAVYSIFPGELAKHAVKEGSKAVMNYNINMSSYDDNKTSKKSAGGKRSATSASTRAGVTMSVARARRIIRHLSYGGRLGTGAPVYLAAVLEYIAAEIFELSGNVSSDSKKLRINKRHVLLAIKNDEELSILFKETLFAGGVVPFVHGAFEKANSADVAAEKAEKIAKKAAKAATK